MITSRAPAPPTLLVVLVFVAALLAAGHAADDSVNVVPLDHGRLIEHRICKTSTAWFYSFHVPEAEAAVPAAPSGPEPPPALHSKVMLEVIRHGGEFQVELRRGALPEQGRSSVIVRDLPLNELAYVCTSEETGLWYAAVRSTSNWKHGCAEFSLRAAVVDDEQAALCEQPSNRLHARQAAVRTVRSADAARASLVMYACFGASILLGICLLHAGSLGSQDDAGRRPLHVPPSNASDGDAVIQLDLDASSLGYDESETEDEDESLLAPRAATSAAAAAAASSAAAFRATRPARRPGGGLAVPERDDMDVAATSTSRAWSFLTGREVPVVAFPLPGVGPRLDLDEAREEPF